MVLKLKDTGDVLYGNTMVITRFPKVQLTGGGLLGPVDLHMKTASSPSLTCRLVGDTVTVLGMAINNNIIHVIVYDLKS